MKFCSLDFNKNTSKRYEEALQRIETIFDVSLTIHDLHGRLGDPQNNTLLPGRHLHPHVCCTIGRNNEPGWNKRCNEECFGIVEERAAQSKNPFLKECYKGLCELVVPIHYEKYHQMTIFAGVFKGQAEPKVKLPKNFLKQYDLLAPPNSKNLKQLATILQLFGMGLLKEFEQDDENLGPDTRLAFIRRFFRNRAHEEISLKDLAEELFISVSRAGHLVKELTGRNFSQLLEEERLRRASLLLLNSTRKLSDIATAVGYSNVYYFNRVFSKKFGIPPGRFRIENKE